MSKEFQQGDIVWFYFPKEKTQPQYTIKGEHPALILHDNETPNKTVILCPITSLYDKKGNKKNLKSFHLPLYKADYPNLINDSYAKLDQIMTFSRNKLNTNNKIDHLNATDKVSLHLKLIEILQMQDTLKEYISKQIEHTVNEVLKEYINKLNEDV